jgi:predicted nucleic acid-binding protein
LKLIRIHYLDASAIVKLILDEPGSAELRQYFGQETFFTATSLCFAEALGVLKAKRFYQKCISDEEYFYGCDQLMAYVSDDIIEMEDIEIKDRSVFNEVEKLTRKHNEGKPKDQTIDISDAFQIVSVKRNYFSQFENTDSKPILITGDRSLAEAARNEGLRVWYCVDEPPPEEVNEA